MFMKMAEMYKDKYMTENKNDVKHTGGEVIHVWLALQIKKLVDTIHNDQELGRAIRSLCNEWKNNKQ